MTRYLALLAIASACNLKFKTSTATAGTSPAPTASEAGGDASPAAPASGGASPAAPASGGASPAAVAHRAAAPAPAPLPVQPVLDDETWNSNAVAAKLGGTLVASGAVKDVLKVDFKAKKGWCYSIFLSPTQGEPKLGEFAWTLPKKQSNVQRYYRYAEKTLFGGVDGACVTEDTAMRGERTVTFAGSTPKLRYAVVGWQKAAFPAHQFAGMVLYMPDPCDSVAWRNIWTDPVPGTLLYWGSQPVLVESQDHASIWVTVRDLHEAMGRAMTRQLVSKPEATLDVPTQVTERPTCHCIGDLKAQYEYDLTMASVAREKASTSAGYKDADRAYNATRNELAERIRKECRADEAVLDRNWKKTLDNIVDTLTRSPAPVGASRVEMFDRRS
jgi:hypothetical protein